MEPFVLAFSLCPQRNSPLDLSRCEYTHPYDRFLENGSLSMLEGERRNKNTCIQDTNPHFVLFGRGDLDLFDLEILSSSPTNCGFTSDSLSCGVGHGGDSDSPIVCVYVNTTEGCHSPISTTNE
jgi:hypothetical protein